MRVALYLRVSTQEQNTANQESELLQACARHHWTVAKIFNDRGISGARGRDEMCLSTLLEEGLRGSRGLSEGMREVSLGNLAHPIPEGG
jgi:DNA invertase Pin-like site-specific DNA recombinase